MRTKAIHSILMAGMLAAPVFSSFAQVKNPDTWETIVNDKAFNIFVTDTFQQQTFNGKESDNLPYLTTGKTEIYDPSQTKWHDGKGKALKLMPGSSFTIAHQAIDGYSDINYDIFYGLYKITKDENILLNVERETNPITNMEMLILEKENTISFRRMKKVSFSTDSSTYLSILNSPTSASLTVQQSTNTKGGYYVIDRVLVYGKIPTYTLFQEKGSWSDPTHWSHVPAVRPSTALIAGDILIDTLVRCRNLHLHNGTIRFEKTGSLHITDSLSIYYDFPEKGKWYFFSLPFDLYPDEIDPAFTFADETSNESGNFFYLATYDGKQRAEQQTAINNWKVVSASTLPTDKPLIEKNKGYLIALDEQAESSRFQFTARGKQLPDDWGRQATIAIEAHSSSSKGHSGWQLCGNPFPSPLSLSRISPNSNLDGYVYLFDGTDYQAYALDSDYAIPPYAAFFVKAARDTELEIHEETIANSHLRLIQSSSLNALRSEPHSNVSSPTAQETVPVEPRPHVQIHRNRIDLQAIPVAGEARIYDLQGKVRTSFAISEGSSTLPLSLPKGFYCLHLETGGKHYHYKFIIY